MTMRRIGRHLAPLPYWHTTVSKTANSGLRMAVLKDAFRPGYITFRGAGEIGRIRVTEQLAKGRATTLELSRTNIQALLFGSGWCIRKRCAVKAPFVVIHVE